MDDMDFMDGMDRPASLLEALAHIVSDPAGHADDDARGKVTRKLKCDQTAEARRESESLF